MSETAIEIEMTIEIEELNPRMLSGGGAGDPPKDGPSKKTAAAGGPGGGGGDDDDDDDNDDDRDDDEEEMIKGKRRRRRRKRRRRKRRRRAKRRTKTRRKKIEGEIGNQNGVSAGFVAIESIITWFLQFGFSIQHPWNGPTKCKPIKVMLLTRVFLACVSMCSANVEPVEDALLIYHRRVSCARD